MTALDRERADGLAAAHDARQARLVEHRAGELGQVGRAGVVAGVDEAARRREAGAAQPHGAGPLVHERDERALRARHPQRQRDRGVVAGRQQQAVQQRRAGTRRPLGSTPTREPGASTAARVIRAAARGGRRSTTSSAVIIFVRLAMGSTRAGSRRHRTAPVSRSKTRPARGWWWKRSAIWSARGGDAQPQRPGARGRGLDRAVGGLQERRAGLARRRDPDPGLAGARAAAPGRARRAPTPATAMAWRALTTAEDGAGPRRRRPRAARGRPPTAASARRARRRRARGR